MAGVTGLAAAVAPTVAAAAPVAVSRATAATTTTSWSDEFNGPAGSAPDSRKWTYNTGGKGWGNRELQYYTSARSNTAMDGRGSLAITAAKAPSGLKCWYGACRYTSARLVTLGRFSQKYGHVEARIKVPAGAGLWPAFWALDNNVNLAQDPAYGETDIMEMVGSEPHSIYSSLHGSRGSAGMNYCVGYRLPSSRAYANGFHVSAADWDSAKVTFSVDGHPYSTRYKSSYGRAWTFDQHMFLVLNLAVGGTWPGTPPSSTRFPATMLVDYVRVRTSASAAVASVRPLAATHAGGCETGR